MAGATGLAKSAVAASHALDWDGGGAEFKTEAMGGSGDGSSTADSANLAIDTATAAVESAGGRP